MSNVHKLQNERNALHSPLAEVELGASPSGEIGWSGLALEKLIEELRDVFVDASYGLERVLFVAQSLPADADVKKFGQSSRLRSREKTMPVSDCKTCDIIETSLISQSRKSFSPEACTSSSWPLRRYPTW